MWGAEQAGLGGEGLELAAQLVAGAVASGAGVALEGDDGVADEGAGAVAQLDEVGGQGEIDHGEQSGAAHPPPPRRCHRSGAENRRQGDEFRRQKDDLVGCTATDIAASPPGPLS